MSRGNEPREGHVPSGLLTYISASLPGRLPILPISIERTIFCVLHAKLRITEKLMSLLAAEAVKHNKKDHWQAVVRALGVANFKVNVEDSDGDSHAPTITSLIGPHCECIIRNWQCIVRETGIQNWEQDQNNYRIYGSGDVHACQNWPTTQKMLGFC